MMNTFEVEIKYTPFNTSELILVPFDLLYSYSLNDSLFASIDHTSYDTPKQIWFDWDTNPVYANRSKYPLKYIPSRAHIDGDSVTYTGGRHRAKWLISKKLPMVPILMGNASMDDAKSKGLVSKIVTGNQKISIPIFDFENVLRENGDIDYA